MGAYLPIPTTIAAGFSPGGVVAVAYGRDGTELERVPLSADDELTTEATALRHADAPGVATVGLYDGDSGALLGVCGRGQP